MSHWEECGQGIAQPLLSARLRLRPVAVDDAPALTEMANDWDVTRYTTLPFPYDLSDAQAMIAKVGRGIVLVLERLVDHALIGCIVAHPDGLDNYEVGYWLGRAHWGQGYASEAARRFIRHLFQDQGVKHIWSTVNPANVASVHVMNNLGMRLNGQAFVSFPNRADLVSLPKYVMSHDQWNATHALRPKVLVSAAALIDSDGRVLMATRPPGKSMSGLWEFPGGTVREDETPEQALARELAEELGVTTGESCMAAIAFASHDYDSFHLLMPLYAIRVWQGTPTPREGQQLKWLEPNQIMTLPMPPADIPLVAMLREWV